MGIHPVMRMMLTDRPREDRREDRPERQEDMRFRDRDGRERYNDGRFAPESRYEPPERWHEPLRRSIPRDSYDRPKARPIGFDGGADATGVIAFSGGRQSREALRQLDADTAREWVDCMVNADGTQGAHWTMEQTEKVRRQKNISAEPLAFWVAMNATYSDLAPLAKKYNVSNLDFFADYAKAFWLHDEDAVPDKLAAYYEAVVKK